MATQFTHCQYCGTELIFQHRKQYGPHDNIWLCPTCKANVTAYSDEPTGIAAAAEVRKVRQYLYNKMQEKLTETILAPVFTIGAMLCKIIVQKHGGTTKLTKISDVALFQAEAEYKTLDTFSVEGLKQLEELRKERDSIDDKMAFIIASEERRALEAASADVQEAYWKSIQDLMKKDCNKLRKVYKNLSLIYEFPERKLPGIVRVIPPPQLNELRRFVLISAINCSYFHSDYCEDLSVRSDAELFEIASTLGIQEKVQEELKSRRPEWEADYYTIGKAGGVHRYLDWVSEINKCPEPPSDKTSYTLHKLLSPQYTTPAA